MSPQRMLVRLGVPLAGPTSMTLAPRGRASLKYIQEHIQAAQSLMDRTRAAMARAEERRRTRAATVGGLPPSLDRVSDAGLEAAVQRIAKELHRRAAMPPTAALGRGGLPMESTLGSNSDRHGQGLYQLGGVKPLGPSAAVLGGGAAVPWGMMTEDGRGKAGASPPPARRSAPHQ